MFIALENLFNGGINELSLDGTEFDFSREKLNGGFPFTTPVVLK